MKESGEVSALFVCFVGDKNKHHKRTHDKKRYSY